MNKNKLLLIDSKVENYHHLMAQVDTQTKVVILQPNQNGIDQIVTYLSKCHQVDVVHIVSHGAKGTLYLGNIILNLDNIHLYVESIQQWGKYLSADGEILIYGCQVASGQEGREFVRQLHQLTGANIAASETLTGNASIGGNWNLEVIFGRVKSALAFTPEVRASYVGVLANIVVDTVNDVVDDDDGVTSVREAIIQANTTPEDDTIQLTAGETYNLSISGSEEDAAATGDLDIVAGGGEITVISEGEEKATIDAGGETGINDRVFHVLEDGSLELENVEVTGGSEAGFGGGILNSGTVIISNSTINGNSGSYTGGILNTGTVIISNSTISNNSAFFGTGGIDNSGIVNISNSSISGNSSEYGGHGGILNSGTANISNSTIAGNSSGSNNLGTSGAGGILNSGIVNISNSSSISGNSGYYGGIANGGTFSISDSIISGNSGFFSGGIDNGGTAIISNSTISGNSGGIRGGGIENSSTVSISDSTITDNSGYFAGGIYNTGTTIISYSTISGNSANRGGAIDNGGTANINNSTISGNSANRGGAIENSGTTSISNSTISGNSANRGGAIENGGTVSISDSTITDNSANLGGGIDNAGGTANISDSTISSNSANLGGGIYNRFLSAAIISNSTITLNQALANQGSGILIRYLDESNLDPITTVTSSIVSGNINTDIDFTGNSNTPIGGDRNLIGTGNAIDSFNGENNQTGVTNPLLGDLADNGGPTLTHLPLPNSPAIDAGSNPNSLTTDQRGEPRFVGSAVDIGAVELQNSPKITGTPESDRLNGTNENNTIIGLAGDDTINGRGGDDQIIGNNGNDFLFGKDGNDILQGRQGNDRLFGGNGGDSLVGGIGRDRINGGAGNDTLTGGASIDRFIFNTNQEFTPEDLGIDEITDFVPQQDIILLDKSTFTGITSNSGEGFSLDIEFAIVTSDAEAETSEAFIVYNSNNGKLFYNANGTESEFGSGGEFANLSNTASISGDDFLLRG